MRENQLRKVVNDIRVLLSECACRVKNVGFAQARFPRPINFHYDLPRLIKGLGYFDIIDSREFLARTLRLARTLGRLRSYWTRSTAKDRRASSSQAIYVMDLIASVDPDLNRFAERNSGWREVETPVCNSATASSTFPMTMNDLGLGI